MKLITTEPISLGRGDLLLIDLHAAWDYYRAVCMGSIAPIGPPGGWLHGKTRQHLFSSSAISRDLISTS